MGHWTPTGIEPADYDDDDDDDDSQTLAAIPAHCWVTSEQNGTVLGACQPSTSSAGSSASSVVSTCQPSIYLICWFLSFICRFYTSALYIISSSFRGHHRPLQLHQK